MHKCAYPLSVSVCGRGLTVKCISAVDVVIEGFITGIDFIT